MESIESRRAAAKRKLDEAKEAVAAKQQSSSRSLAKLRQEVPIGRPDNTPKKQTPKERARELAEKAAAEKAERLAAQRRLRDESSIASQKEECQRIAAPGQAAPGAAWQPSQERNQAIKAKLEAAASAPVTQRLLNARQEIGDREGVLSPAQNGLVAAADSQVAAAYQYLQQRWQSPEVSGALLTLERKMYLPMGRIMDSRVRLLRFGEIERRYGGNCGEALETIHSELGYPLGDALGVPAPDFDIGDNKATFLLSFGAWEQCPGQFLEEYKEITLPFEGGYISSMAYRYLIVFFSQMVLFVIENSDEGADYELPCGFFPKELTALFKENIFQYYLSREVTPALFETQPFRSFAVKQAAWMRQRGWGQH